MTGQEKITKLTLDEMIRRAEQVKEAKSKNNTKELYIESLDGTIVLSKPTRSQVADALDMGSSESDAYLIYECVKEPSLKVRNCRRHMVVLSHLTSWTRYLNRENLQTSQKSVGVCRIFR